MLQTVLTDNGSNSILPIWVINSFSATTVPRIGVANGDYYTNLEPIQFSSDIHNPCLRSTF
jgi:hypothetical protein